MEDCVFLEDPEEGEILEEDISDVVTDATTFEDGMYNVPVIPPSPTLSTLFECVVHKVYKLWKVLK